MEATDFEELSRKLTEIGVRQAEIITKSGDKIDIQSRMMSQLVSVTNEIKKTNKIELNRLMDELQELRKDRDATLHRCDILLEHNKDLSDMLIERDKELCELRERYDRIVSLLESSIFMGKSQPSSATVCINTKEKLDTLKR